jgi:ribonuclease-3
LSRHAALEKRLGYRFGSAGLLDQALTHRSFGTPDNERLEFLGDGVLGCAVAQELYARFPGLTEGELTRLRAHLVREEALAEAARELDLGAALRLGEGEAAGDAEPQPSMLADALEAVFGAVFLDGGYAAARRSILRALGARIEQLRAAPEKDPKTQLQETLQAGHRRLPEYRVVAVHGAAHRRSFEVECLVPDLGLRATGSGSSRQRAEQHAAQGVLDQLGR